MQIQVNRCLDYIFHKGKNTCVCIPKNGHTPEHESKTGPDLGSLGAHFQETQACWGWHPSLPKSGVNAGGGI